MVPAIRRSHALELCSRCTERFGACPVYGQLIIREVASVDGDGRRCTGSITLVGVDSHALGRLQLPPVVVTDLETTNAGPVVKTGASIG